MQRDMDLIRKILLIVEASPDHPFRSSFDSLGCEDKILKYNIHQAIQGGLLYGESSCGTEDTIYCFVTGLTPAGHEFLDEARTEFIWDEVMGDIRKKGLGSTSLEIVKKLLNKKIKEKVGLD